MRGAILAARRAAVDAGGGAACTLGAAMRAWPIFRRRSGRSFTLLDAGRGELARVNAAIARHHRKLPERVLAALRALDRVDFGFAVSQQVHLRQAATRATRAGAGDEWVLAALLHDVGKLIAYPNHAEVGAALLAPYVGAEVHAVLRHHQIFQARFTAEPGSPAAREFETFRGEPWFEAALRFSGEWDAPAFEPGYAALPLAEFEPLLRERLKRPRWETAP
jgi:predicted HD phosphohydrolase